MGIISLSWGQLIRPNRLVGPLIGYICDHLLIYVVADARFDVIGAPYSLLSVSLSASQNLYTRRGTLVGLSGKADNVCGWLSTLSDFATNTLTKAGVLGGFDFERSGTLPQGGCRRSVPLSEGGINYNSCTTGC